MFPDAAIVKGDTPGTFPRAQLEFGMEPVALRLVWDRTEAKGANAASGTLTPLEADLAAEVNLINPQTLTPPSKIRESTLLVERMSVSEGGIWRRRRWQRRSQRMKAKK